MSEDWIYQDDDFDEDLPYVELQFGIDDLRLLYKSVFSVHVDFNEDLLAVMLRNKKDCNI